MLSVRRRSRKSYLITPKQRSMALLVVACSLPLRP
jgi:hypothetical protein